MSDVSFTSKAYCKLILHAAKYPYCAVNGVLLAETGSKEKHIKFVDAVPLFHIALNLTPMAEIALTQIDQTVAQKGLVIAGYYTAHENLRECSFDKAQHRISEKIAENFGNACLVIIDNSKLSLHIDNLAIKVAQYNEGKFRPVDLHHINMMPARTLDICTALMNNRAYEDLVDFDNHLDNISLDWMNGTLNKKIDFLTNN